MNKRLIFRLSDQLYQQITLVIEQDKARNFSEVIRLALKEFLSKEVSKDE